MTNTRKALTVSLLIAVLMLAGCHHKTNTSAPAPPVPADVRIAQVVEIVAVTNQNLGLTLANLTEAGIVKPENAQKIARYLTTVTNATEGIGKVLQNKALPWPDKAIQIQNLCLSLVPPSQYKKFGVETDAQFKALILAIDTLESTIKTVVQLTQAVPVQAPAATQ